jgi:hypothetical protein
MGPLCGRAAKGYRSKVLPLGENKEDHENRILPGFERPQREK